MSSTFVEILCRTLAVIDQHEELWQAAPALVDLRWSLVRAIGEIEATNAARFSEQRAGSDPPIN